MNKVFQISIDNFRGKIAKLEFIHFPSMIILLYMREESE